jgi:hypothetical protein
MNLPPRVRNLTGQHFDLLGATAFVRVDHNGSVWSLTCECGNVVERHATVLHRNARRGRQNGCDTCVPPVVRYLTADEKRAGKRKRNLKYRGRLSVNRFDLPTERISVRIVRAYVVDGKPVGIPENANELAWLRRAFPGGTVEEVAA